MPYSKSENSFNKKQKWRWQLNYLIMKRISSGLAAHLAGIDRVTFLLNLHRYGVAMIDLTEKELISDLANA